MTTIQVNFRYVSGRMVTMDLPLTMTIRELREKLEVRSRKPARLFRHESPPNFGTTFGLFPGGPCRRLR